MTDKILKVSVWTLIIGAILLFWLSLRIEESKVEYTIAALLCWGLSFGLNRWLKARTRKTEKNH